MIRLVFTFIFSAVFLVCCCAAQDGTAWTKLTKIDAEKILNNSFWGKTQTDTDVSEMFYSPTKPGTSSIGAPSAARGPATTQQTINNNRADQGATNQAVEVHYHVRLYSAKPVREAMARMAMPDDEMQIASFVKMMQPFVDRNFAPYIVITVTFDANDGRFVGPTLQAFGSSTVDTLKNKTYLERKDGKRIYLLDYRAPGSDGLGAKFVFERAPGGKLFLNGDSGSFRFYSEVSSKIKLNVTYKITDLIYNRVLEY